MRNTAPPTADFHRAEVHAVGTPFTGLGTLAVGVVTVAALYFGREVFVPMALAILLRFALAPFVLLLRRWHLGRVPSIVAVVVLAFLMIVGIGVFVGNQLAHLAGELPGYQTNIAQKIRSLRDTTTKGGVVDRTSAMLSNLNNEITKPEEKEKGSVANPVAALPRNNQPQDPVPVEIHQPNPSPFLLLQQFAVPLLQPFRDGWNRFGFRNFLPATTGRSARSLHSSRRGGRSEAHNGGHG